jgi:hypothetical protein
MSALMENMLLCLDLHGNIRRKNYFAKKLRALLFPHHANVVFQFEHIDLEQSLQFWSPQQVTDTVVS